MDLRKNEAKCQICDINTSKYSCPTCNLLYCSLTCYQSENHLECSERFYEKCVREELKDCQSDSQSQRKMMEILKQNQQVDSSEEILDSDDEDFELDLASRMLNVDLEDDNEIWEKLTPNEKKEFRKLIASGNIIKIIPDWEPWWKTKKRKALIQECDAEDVDLKSLCPPICPSIPELSLITKSEPSPNIKFMLLNVLASYACTVRFFKGKHKEMCVESISTCIALSSVLRNNEVFENSFQAIISFENDLRKCKWMNDHNYDKNVLNEDLLDIIIYGKEVDDPFFSITAALSDIEALASEAKNVLQDKKLQHLKRFSGNSPKVKNLVLLQKKMTYYLSWTKSHGSLLVSTLQSFSAK